MVNLLFVTHFLVELILVSFSLHPRWISLQGKLFGCRWAPGSRTLARMRRLGKVLRFFVFFPLSRFSTPALAEICVFCGLFCGFWRGSWTNSFCPDAFRRASLWEGKPVPRSGPPWE